MRFSLARIHWQGYGFALLLCGLATLLTVALRPSLQATPALLLLTATILSAWLGGFGPGALASLWSAAAVNYLFLEPFYAFAIHAQPDLLNLSVFLLVALLMSRLAGGRGRLVRETQQRYAQLEVLHNLGQAASQAETDDEVYAAALLGLRRALNVDRASILIADEAGVMRFAAWHGLSDRYRQTTEGHSPWPPGAANPQPVLVADVHQAPELEALRPVIAAEGIRALAFIPLVSSGRLLGKFMLYYNRPHAFEAGEVALAQTMASQLATVIRRRRAQAQVQAERERLRVTLHSIGDAVITTDTAGNVTYVNPVAEALTGWPQAEAAGRPIRQVFNVAAEGTGHPVETPVEKVLREGTLAGLANHTVLRTRDGRQVPIDDSGAPIRDRQGELLGVVLVFRDVRERRAHEQALTTRARQQAAIAALGRLALANPEVPALMDEVVARVADTLGAELVKVLELQPAGNTLLICAGRGWRDGVVGRTLVEAGPDSHAGYTLQADEPVIVADLRTETRFAGMPVLHEHGVVSGMTVTIPGPERPYGVLSVHTRQARAFTQDDANFLQAAANILADALVRARVEDDLRLARDQMAVILDGIAEGVTVQDATGRLVYANDTAARLLGFETGEALLAAPLAEVVGRFEIFDESGQPLSLARLPGRQALQGETPRELTVFFRERQTGAEHWSIVNARPVRSGQAGGAVVMAVNIFHDITELKRAEIAQRVLAEVGGVLADALDYATQLEAVARCLVPRLGDWCALFVHDEQAPGELRLAAAAHPDPARAAAAYTLHERVLAEGSPTAPGGPAHVVAAGQAALYADLDKPAGAPAGPIRLAQALGVRSAVLAPLNGRERTVGVLLLAWAETQRRYTQADLALAEEIARRIAVTADNVRLYGAERAARQAEYTARLEAEQAANHTARLQAVTAALARAINPEQVADIAVEHGVSALGAAAGSIVLPDAAGTHLRVANARGYPSDTLNRFGQFSIDSRLPLAGAYRTGEPVWLESPEARAAAYPELAHEPTQAAKAWAALPLVVGGRILGALGLTFDAPRAFAAEERSLALAIAEQCAQALERAHLYAAQQRARAEAEASRARLAFLAEVGATLATSLEYPGTLGRMAHMLLPYLADMALVYVLEPDGALRLVAAAHAERERQAALEQLAQLGAASQANSLLAQVARNGQPILVADYAPPSLPPEGKARTLMDSLAPRSAIAVPLVARGRTLGVLALATAESGRRYTDADLALAEELARRAALAADNARLFSEAQRLNAELEERVQARTSELERSGAQLRALAKRLQSVREEERTTIAREIHDELGGALTGLKMDLTRLRRALSEGDRQAAEARSQNMLRLIDATVQTVRRMATDLRPAVLDDFGLTAAIEWQLQDFEARAGLTCRLNTTQEPLDLDPDTATGVFRVFQETLTNVARHAQATRVEVTLEKLAGALRLQVRDNGRGISDRDIFGTRSLGLLGMRERVFLLGGDIDIRGAPGSGTTVTVRIPLDRPRPREE